MNRRKFITALAAAFPAGAMASQVATETDPVKAALVTLKAAISETAPQGYKMLDQLFIIDGHVLASAFPPGWENGQARASYHSGQGGWSITAA